MTCSRARPGPEDPGQCGLSGVNRYTPWFEQGTRRGRQPTDPRQSSGENAAEGRLDARNAIDAATVIILASPRLALQSPARPARDRRLATAARRPGRRE